MKLFRRSQKVRHPTEIPVDKLRAKAEQAKAEAEEALQKAEEVLEQVKPVTDALREHRRQNHFTTTFIHAFKGE